MSVKGRVNNWFSEVEAKFETDVVDPITGVVTKVKQDMDAAVKKVVDLAATLSSQVKRVAGDLDTAGAKLGTINTGNLDPEDAAALDAVASMINDASTNLGNHAGSFEATMAGSAGAGGTIGSGVGSDTAPGGSATGATGNDTIEAAGADSDTIEGATAENNPSLAGVGGRDPLTGVQGGVGQSDPVSGT